MGSPVTTYLAAASSLYRLPALLLFFALTCASPLCGQDLTPLYREAVQRVQQRDLQGAATRFEEIIRRDSTHFEAWLGLGELYMMTRRFERARPFLARAIVLQPQRVEARFQFAQTYLKADSDLLAEIPSHSAHKLRARQLFEDIATDFPNHVPTRMTLGELWMTVPPPDVSKALDHYQAVLNTQPQHAAARAGAAASRLRLGQLEQGTAELADLLANDPDNAHIALLAGTAYFRLGRFERAVSTLKQSIDALGPPPNLNAQYTWLRALRVRQWNLRLALRAAGEDYPGALAEKYRIHLAAAPAPSPVRFSDVAPSLGVDKADRGRGVAWGDFDGDGDADLFTTGIHAQHALYRNDGAHSFVDISGSAGLDDRRGGWGASCADYDNDGDLDLYITRDGWEGGAANSLYQNDGNGTFRDVARRAGVEDRDASFTHSWGDYDQDGALDLYVADGISGGGVPNKLFANRGDGTFVEVAAAAGVANPGKSLGVAFGDANGDAFPDLYVSNVDGPNALYINRGNGTFVEQTQEAGVEQPEAGSYVAFFLDYDNDGDFDLFTSAFAYYDAFVESQVTGQPSGPNVPHLYRNEGNGTFIDRAPQSTLARSVGAMGAGFGDIDYDGLIDLYLANGGPNFPRLEPNILYRNLGEDAFEDITESAGVGHLGKGHGVALADYDNDGDLDLYAAVGGHYPGDQERNSLYRNEGPAHRYLIVQLAGAQSNASAIGARVVVRSGDFTGTAEVSSGNGFGSSNSLELEFGLGQRERVDEVVVYWPSGRVSRRRDLASNSSIYISESP